MLKKLLFAGITILLALQVSATNYTVLMKGHKKGYDDRNTTVRRTPFNPPVEVVYDNETRQVEVSGDEEMAAQVYLCDENGNTLDSANSVNAVLNVPETYSGLLIIRVESEEWIATGKIAI